MSKVGLREEYDVVILFLFNFWVDELLFCPTPGAGLGRWTEYFSQMSARLLWCGRWGNVIEILNMLQLSLLLLSTVTEKLPCFSILWSSHKETSEEIELVLRQYYISFYQNFISSLYSLISVDCIFKTNKTGLRPSLHKFPSSHVLCFSAMSVFFLYKKSYHRVQILRWPKRQKKYLFNASAARNNLICIVRPPTIWSETSGSDVMALSCLYAVTQHSKSQLEQILLQIEQF